MKVFDDQANVIEVGQRAADFPVDSDLCLSGLEGPRYSLSSIRLSPIRKGQFSGA